MEEDRKERESWSKGEQMMVKMAVLGKKVNI